METNKNIHRPARPKQWLNGFEVCRFLHISPGTLQYLHSNGTVTATTNKGMIYYFLEDVEMLTEGGSL